jgi:dienelactone hydrolase
VRARRALLVVAACAITSGAAVAQSPPVAATAALPAAAPATDPRDGSPLWGDLVAGPHRAGYRMDKLRDATRGTFRAEGSEGAGGRGYPLVLHYWYPAQPSAQRSPGAAPMTFAAYQARSLIDQQLRDPTPARIAEGDREMKAFYERPFNFSFGAVEPDRWARLGPTPLAAVADAAPVRGRFPLVIGVGGPSGNAVLAEYLATHGYVVALVSSPAEIDLAPVARMEWYVRDLEFALARMRDAELVDARRVATWGFSFAGMPALLAAMRSRDIAAVVSLESAIFYAQYSPQMRGNPFHDPAAVRVPFLHMFREEESRPNEQLAGFEALRYSTRYRYLLRDTTLVHQDFGNHGMAAAAVLEKRPSALAAARRAQVANAEYIRHFLDAYVKDSAGAKAWLARTPEQNGIAPGLLTVERRDAKVPAPDRRAFMAMVERDGIRVALARFHEARLEDPEADLFREQTVNLLGYQLLRGTRTRDAVELFKLNVELYPRSANTFDSLAEAYEVTGDSARALETARRTIEVAGADSTINDAAREGFRRTANERIGRMGGSRLPERE